MTIREAIVLGRSDTAPDKLEGLAHQYPEMLDGKLARLLLSAIGATGSSVAPDEAFQLADPITLSRWITMLSTPYSNEARRLADNFGAWVKSRLSVSDGKPQDSAALIKALRIVGCQP